jgi:oxygen-independent coproporphyrinogen-3 oxidase
LILLKKKVKNIMKQFNGIDIEIFKKFDKPGPRYTSYPTAPLFSTDFNSENYKEEIIGSNTRVNSPDLSLYFHFPFCDTLCYFCGCNMLVTHDRDRISEYNTYLKKELDLTVPLISDKRVVRQLHWGGGSPSYLQPEEIRDVGSYIKKNFTYSDDIEASVEIDPRGLAYEHMQAFRESGFNRISMGVQDFNPKVQEAINRIQPEIITEDAINWSRALGFESINIDLIYGLPYQTMETFADTLDKIIEISPDRIAVFNYAHVPWLKKHMNLIPTDALPTLDQKLHILKMTIERLTEAGYWYVGMNHFAKPDDELAVAQKNKTLYRNFQGYSTKAGCDVYAFGMSAISQFENIYAQNLKGIKDYFNKIDAGEFATHAGYRLTQDDHIRKYVINQLMCDMEVDMSKVEKRFEIKFEEYFSESIPQLEEFIIDGFVKMDDRKIEVSETGKLIIRNIAMCFDAYLEKMRNEKNVFSKTV